MPTFASRTLHAMKVSIPDEVLDAYEDQAEHRGVSVEQLMSDRLTACVEYAATKPLYFDDEQRQRLEKLLGKNVADANHALAIVAKSLVVSVEKVKVNLSPDLIARLRTRCFDKTSTGEQDFDNWLSKIIKTSLQQFAGM